ncbi:hypothetical protein ACEQ8H_007261 [Pleosporales sp. CAS-2024a]
MSRIQKQNHEIQEAISSSDDDGVKIDKIAKIRRWFQPAEGSEYYTIVQEYLAKTLTLDDACQKIFGPIDEKICAQKLDDVNFMDLWYSILHAARRTHYRNTALHQSMLSLVAKFKKHSIANHEKYNYLYDSLTDLSMACRETYNDQPSPESPFPLEGIAWSNLNYFLALLTGTRLVDNAIFAIWAMREALETKLEDDETCTALSKYDLYVPAAAVWILGAHAVLHDKEEDVTPKDEKHGNPARGGELWHGKAEFSKQRWHFWKNRFATIVGQADDGLSETVRAIVKDAVGVMERTATLEKVQGR